MLSGRSLEADARSRSVVSYALALVFNYPHYMATVYRARIHTRSEFARYRIFTLHLHGAARHRRHRVARVERDRAVDLHA